MKAMMVVLTDPVEGAEDEYNSWYSDRHLKDVLAVEGIAAVQRFKLVDGSAAGAPHRYLAIYEIENGEVQAVQAGLRAAREAGWMETSDAVAAGSDLWIFSAITDRAVADGQTTKR
jgi:hypothetical protein